MDNRALSRELAKPIISMIVSTRNRGQKLRGCLNAIRNLESRAAWEVIVVDNGSTDETPAVLDEFSSSMNTSLKVIREPKQGWCRALNRGIASARGEILAFTDDDCYPNPDLLDRTIEAMERRRLDYMGGRIELYDADDAAITIRTDPQPLDIPPKSYLRPGLL